MGGDMHILRDHRLRLAVTDRGNSWSTVVNQDAQAPDRDCGGDGPGEDVEVQVEQARAHLDHTLTMVLRRRGATYRRLLEDTADLLAILRYARTEDETAAMAQRAAIKEVLTD